MQSVSVSPKRDYLYFFSIGFLVSLNIVVLRGVAPFLFPSYYIYILLAVIFFILFLQVDFEVFSVFATHFYIGSILFLLVTLALGEITRGAIRWITLGPITLQPTEIVRPFLIIFFANYLTSKELDLRRFLLGIILMGLPLFLVIIQPSLGVAALTFFGFLGVIFASTIKKKYIAAFAIFIIILVPLLWQILAPYQKARISTFLDPSVDPLGAGYNSIQSMISVGSGKFFGRGLGRGVQTQLAFLPERHNDFIFASVAEELGFLGAFFVILGLFIVLWRLTSFLENSKSPTARAFIAGIFTTFFAQTAVHISMNMGLLPITGVPLPLVSAGGSSLLATMISLGMVLGARK